MMLLTKAIEKRLITNHKISAACINDDGNTPDFKPVVKLFYPAGAATWLITELDPETNIMYGLCDLGHGFPEIGSVSLDELTEFRGRFGLKIERDRYWTADKTLSSYADEAQREGRIIA